MARPDHGPSRRPGGRFRPHAEPLEDRTTPATAFGLGVGGSANTLVRFDTATPGTVTNLAVTGLNAGETLVGVDFRPATAELVGVGINGNTASVYRIAPLTGAATLVGSATVNTIAGATSFGVDFNPVPDRIRVVTNLASDGVGGNVNNFRLNPNNGALAAVDPDLDFTGLPGGIGNAPEVGVAYTNSTDVTPATTTLFGIASGGDRLVTNGGAAPGFPTLTSVGLLGVDTSNNVGFDITGTGNVGRAILEVGGVSGLYTIDLVTGAATLVGTIGDGTVDFAGLAVAPDTPTVSLSVDATSLAEAGGVAIVTATLSNLTFQDVTVPLTFSGTAAPGGDFAASAAQIVIPAGQRTGTITVTAVQDAADEPDEAVTIALGAIVNGTAGVPAQVAITFVDDDVPQPVTVGGSLNGTARVLTPTDGGGYTPGPTLTFFPGSTVNVRTATADVNGDGTPDTIGGTGPGTATRVVILDGRTGATIGAVNPFEGTFTGGVFVSAADLDGDGKAEVVVAPDQGGGPVVVIYSGAGLTAGQGDGAQVIRFFGIEDANFRGGARPALGDVDGDGIPDVVVAAGFLGGPRIAIFDGEDAADGGGTPRKLIADFFAFEDTLRNGAFITAGDFDRDGTDDVAFGGGPGGAPRVRVFDGAGLLAAAGFTNLDQVTGAQLANFFAGSDTLRGGVRLGAADANGDGAADLLAGSGEREPSRVRLYRSATLLGSGNPSPDQELDPFGEVLANGVFVG